MRDVNKIFLMGRLGGDPVQRETKNGHAVVNFSLATSRKFREEASGEELKEETQWHRVVVWGKLGIHCAEYLKKGSPVYVEGMVKSRKYETKEGEPRTSFEIHAEDVSFLPGGWRGTRTTEPETNSETSPEQDAVAQSA